MPDYNISPSSQTPNTPAASANNDIRPTAIVNGKPVTEPFAWMSNTNRQPSAGRYKIQLDTPKSEAIFGSLLIVAGLLLVVLTLQNVSTVTLFVAALLFIIFGGLGTFLLIMAAARRRWFKAYYSK